MFMLLLLVGCFSHQDQTAALVIGASSLGLMMMNMWKGWILGREERVV